MKKYFIALIVFTCIFRVNAQSEFKAGDLEAAGGIGFSSVKYSNSSANYSLGVGPSLVGYANNFVYLGPELNYSKGWNSSLSNSTLFLGGNLGSLIPVQSNAIPYIGIKSGLVINSYSYEGNSAFTSNSDSQSGFIFAIYAGLKCKLNQNVYLNLQPTYTFTNYGQGNKSQVLGIAASFSAKIFSR